MNRVTCSADNIPRSRVWLRGIILPPRLRQTLLWPIVAESILTQDDPGAALHIHLFRRRVAPSAFHYLTLAIVPTVTAIGADRQRTLRPCLRTLLVDITVAGRRIDGVTEDC